ncbi:unnamed protein product [Colias eurytheme]|nr:unnamed protein product [Colias eurytheme]
MTKRIFIQLAGAIFDDGTFLLEAAFNLGILDASQNEENPFEASVIKTSPGDLIEAENGICSLLEESDNLLYQKMYEYMDTHPELMTQTNDIGLERVKSNDEDYAFLMESTSIEYMVERNCDVAQVGGLLDSKGYGIAMKKNSPYRQPMSESILQLQEQGKITRMKDKWWKEKRGGGACALSFKEELMAELRFIFSFSGDVKPVRHRASTSSGSGSKGSKKTNILNDEEEEPKEEDVDPVPTPRSERSSHSRHTSHSRRQSNVKQMNQFRKLIKEKSVN